MIDCDVHHVITDHAEFLEFVEPGQREWFRTRPNLGLPAYPWTHPVSWWQEQEDEDSLPKGSTLKQIQAGLDLYGTEIGILNANDALVLSVHGRLASRARARARPQRLGARRLARRRAAAARLDPRARAGSDRRRRRDPPGGAGRPLRPGAAVRRLRATLWRAPLPADLRGRRRVRPARRRAHERRGHGHRRVRQRRRPPHLLHRVAHRRLGVEHHGAPRLARLLRRLPALPGHAGRAARGRRRLDPRPDLAARHELARHARRGAVARRAAERDDPQARPLRHAAARAHARPRRRALRDARDRRRPGHPRVRLRLPALGSRRSRPR